MYLSVISMSRVNLIVSIGTSHYNSVVTCTVGPDDVIVAVHPNKFFITAESTNSVGSTFFLEMMYATTPTGAFYNNARACSDGGLSVMSIDSTPETQQTEEEPKDQVTKIPIATTLGRQELQAL
jgi:hypothetical protein